MPNEYREVRVVARQFYDAQKSRIRAQNRYRAATARDEHIDPSFVEPIRLMEDVEAMYQRVLRNHYRQVVHPAVREWVDKTPGLGEHLMARLLGEIGDPAIAYPAHWEESNDQDNEGKRVLVFEEPFSRGVRELWAYCGFGDPDRRRKKGMTQEDAFGLGNPLAKTLAWQLAESCIKQNGTPDKNGKSRARSPYRDCYEKSKAHYAERDWTPKHIQNAATRYTAKAILKDMWRVVHGQEPAYGEQTEWTPRASS